MTGSVARRYSKALFELAKEAATLDGVAAELAKAAAIAADPEIRQVLRNPLLSNEKRREIVQLIIGEIQPSDLVVRFLSLLGDRQRLGELPGIERSYLEQLDEEFGRARINITSAAKLRKKQEADIVKKFSEITGKEVIPTVTVDQELIGGVVVEAEGRVYDGSVKTHFARIAKELAGASL